MKKLTMILSVLLAACVALGSAFAQEGNDLMCLQIALDSNPTTGYAWTAFVLAGDSVSLSEGEYIPDADPSAPMAGVGGQTVYTLQGVKPGISLIRFMYLRPWETEIAEQMVYLISVDEQLHVDCMDVTESGVIEGVVISVNADEHSVLLDSDRLGQVIALIDGELALPVQDEAVVLYTDGKITMSLPGIVNVMAWESVPSELARGAQLPSLGELTGLTAFAALITDENPIASVYYEDGTEMHVSFMLEDAEEMQALFALVQQLEIESVSDTMVTDWYPVLRFTALNGESWSIGFDGHWLSAGRENYNLSNDAPLWKMISRLGSKYAVEE